MLDEDGERVKNQIIHKGAENVRGRSGESASWWYLVSRSFTLPSLSKGKYGIRILDFTDGQGGREYRNMHLVVTKLG